MKTSDQHRPDDERRSAETVVAGPSAPGPLSLATARDPRPARRSRVRRSAVGSLAAAGLVLAGVLGCAAPEASDTAQNRPPSNASKEADAKTGAATPSTPAPSPGPLRVDGRRLVDAKGASFLWLGDTAWNLTSLTREEVDRYLNKRKEQGFTVIQTVAVWPRPEEMADGYGHLPFDGDMSRIRTTPGSAPDAGDEYDYWDHVDYILRGIHRRQMTAALLPAWSFHHAGRTLTAENARGYGEFLAKRYGADGVVWVFGGDDPDPHPDIWPLLADGVRAGAAAPLDGEPGLGTRTTQDRPLITYHPAGFKKQSYAFGATDFAMVQTGHCIREGYTSFVADSYREVNKPILDSEPLYEDHPWCWKTEMGYARTDEVRKAMYWSVFAGGFGVTYGNHSVWQFYVPGRGAGLAFPRLSWQDALDRPAAGQMRHLGALLRLRPDDQRVPDDALLKDGVRSGWDRRTAIRDGAGRWAMAYLPSGGSVQLDLGRVSGKRVRVSWFDPRTGELVDGGEKADSEAGTLTSPQREAPRDDSQDWVLIVDAL